MSSPNLIPFAIVPSVRPSERTPPQVAREFRKLLDSKAKFVVAGKAKKRPLQLLERGLTPRHKISLFDTEFYFTGVLQMPELRFFVCYVVQKNDGVTSIYPRIVYKDLSLAWRSASHFTFLDGDIWVGKGDVRIDDEDGYETVESIEATTDLPLEMQTAVESLLPLNKRVKDGVGVLELVLRRSPEDRVEPYEDFTAARKTAQANPKNLINRGRSVAKFRKQGSPESLVITKGFEPDFENGVVEKGKSRSKLYGGVLRRYRIVSTNKKVQYYFIAGSRHVWMYPPQATTTDLSSYGVRTIDVEADDDLSIPGYEYHHEEETENGIEIYSQIPVGFAGAACPVDDVKADASPWIDRLPVIVEFRKRVLKQR